MLTLLSVPDGGRFGAELGRDPQSSRTCIPRCSSAYGSAGASMSSIVQMARYAAMVDSWSAWARTAGNQGSSSGGQEDAQGLAAARRGHVCRRTTTVFSSPTLDVDIAPGIARMVNMGRRSATRRCRAMRRRKAQDVSTCLGDRHDHYTSAAKVQHLELATRHAFWGAQCCHSGCAVRCWFGVALGSLARALQS